MVVRKLAIACLVMAAGIGAAATPVARGRQAEGARPQQGEPPVFRAKTDVVPVTVTAVDRQGKPVTGLTQADFEVFENGKRREIAVFHTQSIAAGAVSAGGRMAPATRRNVLIIFGLGRIEEPTDVFNGLDDFLQRRLLPQDRVALMGFHRATSLTTDHAAVRGMTGRYRREHARLWTDVFDFVTATRPRMVLSNFAGPPLPKEMLDDIDRSIFGVAALAAPSSRSDAVYLRTTANLLLNIDRVMSIKESGWLHRGKRINSFKDLQDAVTAQGFNLRDGTVISTRLKFLAGIEYLRHLDGEKRIVILAQDSITMSYVQGNRTFVDNAAAFVRLATDARVIIDFIWTGGTRLRGDSGCPPCRDLAEGTGGSYTSLGEVGPALARVDELSRESYLIGYVPPDVPQDGVYRRLEVRTRRPGVRLIYRAGYYAVPEVAPEALVQRTAAVRQEAAQQYELDVDDIGVDVSADPVTRRDGKHLITARVSVDTSRLLLVPEGSLRTGQLDLKIFVGDARERVIASEAVRVQIREASQPAAPPAPGFQRTFTLQTTELPAYVKVVAYEYGTDRLGSRSLNLPGPK